MAPEQTFEIKENEKKVVKGYFETTGFDRWNRIYSDSDDVNKVQRNIRIGHQKTVDEVRSAPGPPLRACRLPQEGPVPGGASPAWH